MQRTNNLNGLLLFLIGLFTSTEVRIVGAVGISELVLLLVAPFVFISTIGTLRKDGFMPYLYMTFIVMAGCLISAYANKTPTTSLMKGFAEVYSLFAVVVCLHRLLRDDFLAIRWLVLGGALSSMLCIFIFQKGSVRQFGDDALISADAMAATIGYAVFWANITRSCLYVPIEGWYLKMKKWYFFVASIVVICSAMFLSGASGRSSTLCAGITAILLMVGSPQRKRLDFLRRHLIMLGAVLLAFGIGYKAIYREMATSGMLGEEAQNKYMRQTKRGSGIISLLMGGRAEFFAGGYACLQKPLLGYGSWAVDTDGVYGEFLRQYGVEGEYENYILESYRQYSNGGMAHLIPGHSCIIQFWLWFGIMGLIFWIYILLLLKNVLFKWLAIYPPWYGYLACVVPLFLWNVFFSPFGGRIGIATLITVCLFIRAVACRGFPAGGVLGRFERYE